MSLSYNAENHTYYYKGKLVPSVNQILKSEGVIPDFTFPAAKAKCTLGTYVHQAIDLHFQQILDESSLQGKVKDYFNGFRKFQSHLSINPVAVEKKMYSERWGFAGTSDFFTDKILYDIKCSATIYPYYSLTLAAYKILTEEDLGHEIEETIIVKLMPNDYKLEVIKPKKQEFLAFLNTYQWKQKYLREV